MRGSRSKVNAGSSAVISPLKMLSISLPYPSLTSTALPTAKRSSSSTHGSGLLRSSAPKISRVNMLGISTLSSTVTLPTCVLASTVIGVPSMMTSKLDTSGLFRSANGIPGLSSTRLWNMQDHPGPEAQGIIQMIGLGDDAPQFRIGVHLSGNVAQAVSQLDHSCGELGIILALVILPAFYLSEGNRELRPKRYAGVTEESEVLG